MGNIAASTQCAHAHTTLKILLYQAGAVGLAAIAFGSVDFHPHEAKSDVKKSGASASLPAVSRTSILLYMGQQRGATS